MKLYSWLLALTLPLASAMPYAGTGPLCREGETNLFSFNTASGKTVSVCVGQNSRYLVYRFGTPNQTELQYPAVLDGSS